MDWLRRIGSTPAPDVAAAPEPRSLAAEGAAPGIAALLDGVSEDRSHAVLDLGTACDQNLRAYSRFARWIRFADLLGETMAPHMQAPAGARLRTVLPPDRRYDLVFGWDILDRLFPDERPRLGKWLADITLPNARLHFIVRAEHAIAVPLRFTLLDVDRIRYEPSGTALLTGPRLLPSEVARVLSPLRIAHAFTLRSGLREYTATRPGP